ncbi:hypothetical protein HZY93_05215 [Streptococcus danieliae]|uniref:Uncharacterized protein n=1 Tax=Streptococcus danieliae TaxID=747656 RepID=A0A7Z0LDH2_9STRE|nr:hypothetical protein [Streptococcus danieliae]MBF0717437.1 hypothetical protein [Streptococcus danieliae]NYS49367.1 hypothetical protein [Streptococcus danieliae]
MNRLFLYLLVIFIGKKIIEVILNILALIPIIITVVVLIVAIISFLSSVLSSTLLESIFHSEYRSLAVIILLTLLSLYGIRLKRLQIKQKIQCYYCLIQLILAIGIIIFNSRISIVFNLIVGTIFGLIFDPKLQNVRTYFQRSRNALVAFNLFDLCFIISCFLLMNIDSNNLHELNIFINKFAVSEKDLKLISVVLSSIVLFRGPLKTPVFLQIESLKP